MDANFRCQATDGIGERDDLALERDRVWQDRPPEPYTRWEDYHADADARLHSNDWGDSSLKGVIEGAILGGKTHLCLRKADYRNDLAEVIENIQIQRGWDSSEFDGEIYEVGELDFDVILRLP